MVHDVYVTLVVTNRRAGLRGAPYRQAVENRQIEMSPYLPGGKNSSNHVKGRRGSQVDRFSFREQQGGVWGGAEEEVQKTTQNYPGLLVKSTTTTTRFL